MTNMILTRLVLKMMSKDYLYLYFLFIRNSAYEKSDINKK